MEEKGCRADCRCPRCDDEMAMVVRMTSAQAAAYAALTSERTLRAPRGKGER